MFLFFCFHLAANGAFGERFILTILVQILSIAKDSNGDFPRIPIQGERTSVAAKWLLMVYCLLFIVYY
jgi:hypothetical protein